MRKIVPLIFLLIPLVLVPDVLAQQAPVVIIPLTDWQAANITVSSIYPGGVNYRPGVEYLYAGYLVIPTTCCGLEVQNAKTGRSMNIPATVFSWQVMMIKDIVILAMGYI